MDFNVISTPPQVDTEDIARFLHTRLTVSFQTCASHELGCPEDAVTMSSAGSTFPVPDAMDSFTLPQSSCAAAELQAVMVNFLSTQVDVEFTLSSSEIRRNDQIRSIAMVTLASLELRGSWAHDLQCVRRGEVLLAVI